MDKVGQAIAKAEAEKKRDEQFTQLVAKVDELTAQVAALVELLKPQTAPVEPAGKAEAKTKKG